MYSVLKTGICVNITQEDILEFLAIELVIGVMKLPAYTGYWSSDITIEHVANIMPINKYTKIRQY